MVVKEFLQLRRDRRTLAMMIVLPILLLVPFGYAASFDVKEIPTTVVGAQAEQFAGSFRAPFEATKVDSAGDRTDAERALRDDDTPVAFVTGSGATTALLDGSELFTATAARTALAEQAAAPGTPAVQVEVLYNEELETSAVMVPGLAG